MKIKKFLAITITFILLFSSETTHGINVIFEGINACGKTTVIEALQKLLIEKGEVFCAIDELKGSPVCDLLSFQKNSFRLIDTEDFKTSVYETLLLGADCRYKQERFGRELSGNINIFDRDFPTILAYQKCILHQDYGEKFSEFYEPFKRLMFFDLMPIKTIVYLRVPIEVSIERINLRGREEPCTNEQVEFLIAAKDYYEKELIPELMSMGIDVTILDGTAPPEVNAEKIYKKIKGL